MTLNIDLEEVPFAILEAVKARIMANRRRLGQQQQPRPSTRPRPQFVKIGANSKTWRLPKTAAMVLDDRKVLLINWDGINPDPSDPAAVVTIPGNTPSPNVFATDIQSVPAVGVISVPLGQLFQQGGSWRVASSSLPRNLENFTLELWGLHGVQGSFFELGLYWQGETSLNGISAITRANVTGGFSLNQFIIGGSGATLAGANESLDTAALNKPFHLCIQRSPAGLSFFYDGVLFTFPDLIGTSQPVIGADPYLFIFLNTDVGLSGSNKLSQVRVTTGEARYPQTGFTPDSLPLQLQ